MSGLRAAYVRWRERRQKSHKEKLDTSDQARRSLEKHPPPRTGEGGHMSGPWGG